MKYIIWAFILVMVYRFVVRFLLPVIQVTRSAQDKMRQMQEQMNNMQQAQQQPPKQNINPDNRIKDGDYIEYEEVK